MNIWNRENLEKILAMRDEGKKFREIGDSFEISVTMARSMVMKAKRERTRGWKEYLYLSAGALRCLEIFGIEKNKEAIKKAITDGGLKWQRKKRGDNEFHYRIGKGTFREIYRLVGVEFKEEIKERCPTCGQIIRKSKTERS